MKTYEKSIRRSMGYIKSRLIYDFKPFNRVRMLNFYSYFIQPGDLCFDLGAHTGNRTGTWIQLGAKVVAVEPQPLFVELLQKKFRGNSNFFLEEKAIGKGKGKGTFYISRMNPAISTLSGEWQSVLEEFDKRSKWEDMIEVDLLPVDELIEKYGVPVFCKIDVEGFENEVLAGLSMPIPSLSFEFFPTTTLRTVDCIEMLEKLGAYQYNWSLTESFRLISPHWLSASGMIQTIKAYRGRKSGDIYASLPFDE
jgi:FkbM family methyltransferase